MRNFKGSLLFFLMLLIPSVSYFFSPLSGLNKESIVINPKSSDHWVLGPLHINDAGGGDYTWAEAAAQAWCSGNGSLINPYTIENITIDAGWNDNALLIENSNNKFFTIRNCTLMNAGSTSNAAGIKLLSTSNGTLEDNKCLNNNKGGIYIESNSNYNTIQNNYIYNSTHAGIRVYQSSYNIIRNNNITEGVPSFSSGIYIDWDSTFNVAFNNTITTHDYGIEVTYSSHNNTIVSNDIGSITWDGISARSDSSNTTIKMNNVNGTFVGILLDGSTNGSLVYGNIITNGSENGEDSGIYNRWDNGTLGNYWDDYGGSDLDDDGIGDLPYGVSGSAGSQDNFPIWDDGLEPIFIDGTATGVGAHNWTWAENQPWCTGLGTSISPYVIEGISRDGRGDGFCISVQNSEVFFEVRNCNLSNAGFVFADAAILLNNVANATIIGNDLTDNNFIGVLMDNSDNNYITSNNASLTDLGILMTNSEFNYISGNTINDNIENAINIDDNSNNNTVSGNTANHNNLGISIFSDSDNNTVTDNTVMNNNIAGISILSQCDDNYVLNNEISDNNVGVSIATSDCHYNTIYNNTFTLNTKNGEDDSANNNWNYGTLGNYWDDYTGFDTDDDGIGDFPYNISGLAGSKDFYPIWDDGDDINPTISIISPSGGTLFGTDAPTYNLDIFDLNLNQSWYTLNSTATRYFFTPVNGINLVFIDETGWDVFADGAMVMTFNVNDSGGNPASISNVVIKDVTLPTITLNSPLGGTIFEVDAPEFNLTIYDINLNNAWYTIGSSGIPHSFTPNDGITIIPIDQGSWDALPEGNVPINFFVNDTAGNIRTIQVIVDKDIPGGSKGIPYGNFYLIFLGIGIISVLLVEYKKKRKS
ncbi:MAG: right-handed parallel beta-helix repeat-containing protein [Candidatus Lokiarchaeota archaeon]|nr:right-handed parallel beta-helix repeat-containing protein [Candidatus Lokiarchaeota archaeon]